MVETAHVEDEVELDVKENDEVEETKYAQEAVPPQVPQELNVETRRGAPSEGSLNDTFDDTAEMLLTQIDQTVEDVDSVVASETTDVMMDEAQRLRFLRNALASDVEREHKKLDVRTNICQSKFAEYRKQLSRFNTIHMCLGILISVFASITAIVEREINETFDGPTTIVLGSVTPIVGAVITILGSIARERKLVDKIFNLGKIINQAVELAAPLPGLAKRIRRCLTMQEYNTFDTMFQNQTSVSLNACFTKISQELDLTDTVFHTEAIHYLKLRHQTADANYSVKSARINQRKTQHLETIENEDVLEEVTVETIHEDELDSIEHSETDKEQEKTTSCWKCVCLK